MSAYPLKRLTIDPHHGGAVCHTDADGRRHVPDPDDARDLAWLMGCKTCARAHYGQCISARYPGQKQPADGKCLWPNMWIKNPVKFGKWLRIWRANRPHVERVTDADL